jgi:inositol transport system substrate-binding protein
VERRRSWEQEFFTRRPDVTIVGVQSGHWNKDEGMRYMEDWAQTNPQIDAVVSMNDNMAMGALEAVKGNPRFDSLLVYDGDAAAAALLIEEGRMTATAFQNADELARKNMELANQILTGASGSGVVNTEIVCPLYTKDNVAELIAVHKRTGALK